MDIDFQRAFRTHIKRERSMSSENYNIKRIFLTHCSAKKDKSFKENNIQVTPDRLYTATATQRFMNKCKNVSKLGNIFR
jgi:hypothetical protein